MPSKNSSRYGVEVSGLLCASCGAQRMRRVARRGFLQSQIFSLFGYYPWECAVCRKVFLLRKRHQRNKRSQQESSLAEQ